MLRTGCVDLSSAKHVAHLLHQGQPGHLHYLCLEICRICIKFGLFAWKLRIKDILVKGIFS